MSNFRGSNFPIGPPNGFPEPPPLPNGSGGFPNGFSDDFPPPPEGFQEGFPPPPEGFQEGFPPGFSEEFPDGLPQGPPGFLDGFPSFNATKCSFTSNSELIMCFHDYPQRNTASQYEALIMTVLFNNSFTLWLALVFLLNKKWKRMISYLLIAFYVSNVLFKISQEFIFLFTDLIPSPFTTKGKILNFVYNTFFIIYNLIGDWYPALRTSAVIKDRRSVKLVYTTCILYNITKIISFYSSFRNFKLNFNYYFTVIIASLIYEVSILYVMRKKVFNSTNMSNSKLLQNSFMERFKQASEYRIYISVVISLFLIPIYILYYIFRYAYKLDIDSKSRGIAPFIETYLEISLSFNYYIMFIDQILLQFYVKRYKTMNRAYSNEPSVNYYTSYNNSSSNHTKKDNNYLHQPMISIHSKDDLSSHQPSISIHNKSKSNYQPPTTPVVNKTETNYKNIIPSNKAPLTSAHYFKSLLSENDQYSQESKLKIMKYANQNYNELFNSSFNDITKRTSSSNSNSNSRNSYDPSIYRDDEVFIPKSQPMNYHQF